MELGIGHYFGRPRTPKDNCLVERVIKTSCQEAWDCHWSEDPHGLQSICADRVHFYNHVRPHKNLANVTPMDYCLSRWHDEAAPDTDQGVHHVVNSCTN